MGTQQLRKGTLAGCVTVVALVGCTVEQTEPGRAPDVSVDVEPGRWPDYDVNWIDVDVGTSERTITVPVVRVVEESRRISVPYIDITPPGAREREERTISMEVDVPHSGYSLEITEIRAAGGTLWVIGTLTETGGMATQAITRVSDQVVVNAPEDLDVRKVVVGQRPPGVYNQQFQFVDSASALAQHIPLGAEVIYRRGQQTTQSGRRE